MRLYRGITVPVSSVQSTIANIHSAGLQVGQGTQWSITWVELKPRLQELRRANPIDPEETRTGSSLPRVCACGDEIGATYYATRHNMNGNDDTPILIEFDANVADVIVDGRDFLYPVFQGGDPQRARDVVKECFGESTMFYLDRAWATKDQQQRVAWCNLAVQDNDVVASHASNRKVLGGRYNTCFCSAFMVLLPVPPSQIRNVKHLQQPINVPQPGVSVYDIRA